MPANPAELAYVKETLLQLEAIGLRRNETFGLSDQVYADAVVDGYPDSTASQKVTNRIVRYAPFPRLAVLWVINDEETGEALAYFRNSLVFHDHCFDVADLDDYKQLLDKILATASEDWNASLSIDNERRGFFSSPKTDLAIEFDGERHALAVSWGKDFDWAMIAQLNVLIPDGVNARFACCGDGGTVMVVWLSPEKISRLSEYCGVAFGIP